MEEWRRGRSIVVAALDIPAAAATGQVHLEYTSIAKEEEQREREREEINRGRPARVSAIH